MAKRAPQTANVRKAVTSHRRTTGRSLGPSPCDDGLLTPWPEAAEFLRVGRSKIFELLANGTLPSVRVFDGGPRRIPKRALVEYLNGRIVEMSR